MVQMVKLQTIDKETVLIDASQISALLEHQHPAATEIYLRSGQTFMIPESLAELSDYLEKAFNQICEKDFEVFGLKL